MTAHAFCVVDAFTDRPFAGNPAAVMLLDSFPDDDLLARIAAEHNYAETAFLVRREPGRYDLRWFTPSVEVPLCGHGTLAAAHALVSEHGEDAAVLRFETRSGALAVQRDGAGYVLDLPADLSGRVVADAGVARAIGARPDEVIRGRFLVAAFASEAAVRALAPDMAAVAALDADEVIATAPGLRTDFVSRMFAPKIGIPEDPFTGSAHTILTPYWAARFGRTTLSARQVSLRGGTAVCTLSADRVRLKGSAVTTMRGEMIF